MVLVLMIVRQALDSAIGSVWSFAIAIVVAVSFNLLVAWWPGLSASRRGVFVAAYADRRFLLARANWLTGRAVRIVLDVPVEAVSIVPMGPPVGIRVRVDCGDEVQDWDLTTWLPEKWPIAVQVPTAPTPS